MRNSKQALYLAASADLDSEWTSFTTSSSITVTTSVLKRGYTSAKEPCS